MKTANEWLNEYGYSHQNETNKTIHWICVPVIFFTIVGLLYSIKLPVQLTHSLQLNAGIILIALVSAYYLVLSRTIWVGMLLFGCFCLWLAYLIETYSPVPLWSICTALFVIAWIGQFYGHKVEGKKPSFFKDVQFLMIGPMWLMSFVYRKFGLRV